MLTFLEPLYPALAGILTGAVAMGAKTLLEKVNARKYAPILAKVYDVVDPLFDKYYAGWDGSVIDTVLELAFHSVGDGQLTPCEAQRAVQMAKEKFLPDVAKTKQLDPTTLEGRKSLEIAEMVLKLEEGFDKDALIDIAKASVSLSVKPKVFGLL